MQLYYLVFGLFFMFSSSVSAVELETIKVTSSRGTLTAENMPASLSVFTSKEIERKDIVIENNVFIMINTDIEH